MPPVVVAVGTALGASAATAATVGTVALVGTAGLIGSSIYKSKAQATAAKKASDHQAYLQGQELAKLEAKENEATLSAEKIQARDTARAKQQREAASAVGRRNTILTSPLGVAGDGATGQRKTLLGS